jgi:Sulfotransferase family
MSSSPRPLPNFFIVGAPKAGTTSLYHYLDQHPDVYMSPVKEPCHFSEEIRLQNFSQEILPGVEADLRAQQEYLRGPMTEKRFGGVGMEWDDYLRLFENVKGEAAIGEASVLYLWSKTAARNIQLRVPNARILMVLRDPVGRAFSQYLDGITAGVLHGSFRDYIEACLSSQSEKISLVRPSLELGLYSAEVKRYLDRFTWKNVHIVLYDDLQQQQAKVLAGIFDFIAVDSNFSPDTSHRYLIPRVPRSLRLGHFLKKHQVWQRAAKMKPSPVRSFVKKLLVRPAGATTVNPRDRQFLLDHYRDDIQKLAVLLDRDLAAWLR